MLSFEEVVVAVVVFEAIRPALTRSGERGCKALDSLGNLKPDSASMAGGCRLRWVGAFPVLLSAGHGVDGCVAGGGELLAGEWSACAARVGLFGRSGGRSNAL